MADNEKLRRSLVLVPAGNVSRKGTAETMGDQNGRLLREISILMQR